MKGELRVVYRRSLDGRSFLVQENRPRPSSRPSRTTTAIANWHTVGWFCNLLFALEAFPAAAPDPMTEHRQVELETTEHAREATNDRRPECALCGRVHGGAA